MISTRRIKNLRRFTPVFQWHGCVVALAAFTLCAPSAWANPSGTVSAVVFRVEAETASQSASWEALFDAAFFDAITGTYDWTLPSSVDLMDGPDLVATLESATLHLETDPEVAMGFHVTAPGSATIFTITSALVSFPGIFEPEAFATAGITVTDNQFNGASLTGEYAGNTKSYIANYNGLAPAGTNFGSLVDNVPFFTFGSMTESEDKPVQIGGPPAETLTLTGATVSSISSQFNFTLSAGDQASGTSTFIITPEPATMGLLAIGALALGRRRRT